MRQQTLADEGFERYRKPTHIGKVRLNPTPPTPGSRLK